MSFLLTDVLIQNDITVVRYRCWLDREEAQGIVGVLHMIHCLDTDRPLLKWLNFHKSTIWAVVALARICCIFAGVCQVWIVANWQQPLTDCCVHALSWPYCSYVVLVCQPVCHPSESVHSGQHSWSSSTVVQCAVVEQTGIPCSRFVFNCIWLLDVWCVSVAFRD